MFKVALVGEFHNVGKEYLKNNKINIVETLKYEAEDLKNILSDCDAIGIRTAKLPEEVLSKCKNLKVVARHGVGYDSVDLNYLNQNKIPLAITGSSNAVAVAEHVIAMFLSLSKKILASNQTVTQGQYTKKTMIQNTVELYKKKVLIIGFGRIGKEVAKRLSAFDTEILIYDPFLKDSGIDIKPYTFVDLHTGLKESNFITIHIPLSKDTENFISHKELSLMKNDTILVNTSRGGIVNQHDLLNSLEQGKLLGAGLDVYTVEPPPKDDPILTAPNIILTPHNAALTIECRMRMSLETAKNILSVLENNPNLENIVNKNIL